MNAEKTTGTAPFTLAPPPYPENALEPVISERTLGFHHGKHHQKYVDTLNSLISGSEYENATLENIILDTNDKQDKTSIFNNAAQVWNHAFYWNSLKPNGGGEPPSELMQKIKQSFGTLEDCRQALIEVAVSQFGSGWAWLAYDGNRLRVVNTPNARVPFTDGLVPLLTIDVWEHAYYLDYQNQRKKYVQAVVEKLLNWEFALKNLS